MSGHCNRVQDGIDVWMLRELGCRALVCRLEELPGKKDLVIDKTLMKLLDRLAQAAILRKHDVDKIYRLEHLPPSSQCPQRVYLLRPTPDNVKLVVDHISHQQQLQLQQQQQTVVTLRSCATCSKAEGGPSTPASTPRKVLRAAILDVLSPEPSSSTMAGQKQKEKMHKSSGTNSKVVVYCVPRVTHSAHTLLEEEGFAGNGLVSLLPYCPGFVPVDDDLLTLEMPTFFRDAFVDGDLSACAGVGEALHLLHCLYGRPRRLLAHGRAAQAVMAALNTREYGNDGQDHNTVKCEIGQLFVFDRDADLVTPLLTQLTYEGSVDEHFDIQAGVAELPQHVAGDSGKQGHSKVMLNCKDAVFASIRHKHFAGVAGQLVRRAKEIQTKKEESKTMTPAQMKNFVAKDLKELQAQQTSISLHLSVCEAITKATRRDFDVQLTTEHGLVTGATTYSEAKVFFEDCCARQLSLNTSLRLLCLLSLTQSHGLSTKDFETLLTQLVAASGYRHLISLFELRQAGLICVSETSGFESSQGLAIKGLRQAATNLIGRDLASRWRNLAKTLKLIPDPDEAIDLHNPNHMSYVFNGAYTPAIPQLVSVCLTRGAPHVVEALRSVPGTTLMEGWAEDHGTSLPPVVLVVVLGGVTFAELAAFRLLGLRTGNRIIVASTGTTTGTKIMTGITSSILGALT